MILFVCDSNASMSPMAEALLKDFCPAITVQSAGLYPSHIRQPLRQVLREINVDDFGLCSKDLFGVDLTEVQTVIGLGMPDSAWRLPSRLEITWWVLPDPSCFPNAEQLDSYRALRDELLTRIKLLLTSLNLPSY